MVDENYILLCVGRGRGQAQPCVCVCVVQEVEVHMKNSSVECDNGSQVLPGRSNIDISITRKPRYVGSVICKPFGL